MRTKPIDLFTTFRVMRSRGEMCIGHGRLCVRLSVPRRILTLLHGFGCNLVGMIGGAL